MTEPRASHPLFIDALRAIVGARYVLTNAEQTRTYTTGFRFGGGPVAAVVRPGTLVEQWRILQACTAAGCAIVMQSANTGLTGGSTPDGTYDRPVVLVNTMRISKLFLIGGGRQAICLPGTTLHSLEAQLRPLGREPHSVIGSSCLGATVVGGVCNNSGGALVQRGPVYTELALFARIDECGKLLLVNHLGIELGAEPEEMLARLENGEFGEDEIAWPTDRRASDENYARHVRKVDSDTPARFNADPARLFEASGSAGKIAIFAVRLDTFVAETESAVFYIGTNDPQRLSALRRHILSTFETLPVSGEYIHRTAYALAARYGRDMVALIRFLGTGRLPALFSLKARVDAAARRFRFLPAHFSDRIMQALSRFIPDPLPRRMTDFHERFEHHLILKMSGRGIDEARQYLESNFADAALADHFECDAGEGERAMLHRFAVAGAAVRYRSVHGRQVEDIVALDIALRRNDENWFERLPTALEADILHKLYYGHFFCHVFHQDYVIRKGANVHDIEERMLAALDGRGAEYPAEHNVGHLYRAKEPLRAHYVGLDPCNQFNPGIGGTSKSEGWR